MDTHRKNRFMSQVRMAKLSTNDHGLLCPCQICIIHVHVHAIVTLENVGFSLHVLAIGTTQDAYIHIPINSSDALMCMCWLGLGVQRA